MCLFLFVLPVTFTRLLRKDTRSMRNIMINNSVNKPSFRPFLDVTNVVCLNS